MAIDTKPNLSNNKFEQCATDIMNLSGCTQIYGKFDVESGATLTICDNRGLGKVLTSDADGIATWQTIGGGSGTVTSVTATTSTSGTDVSVGVTNSTTTPLITLCIPTASATNRGALSAANWSSFNAKTTCVGTVTNIATSSPITGGPITTGGTIGIQVANTSQSGYLTNTDWNTFNSKTSCTGTITGGANGLSTSGTDVILGGVLTQNTCISGNNKWFHITGSTFNIFCATSNIIAGGVSFIGAVSGGNSSGIEFNPNCVEVNDEINSEGLTYCTNYCAVGKTNPRWIPDNEYVTGLTSTAGVTSFNTRTGAITLTSGDVTTALTFTPYNATNPNGYTSCTGTVKGTGTLNELAYFSTTGSDTIASLTTATYPTLTELSYVKGVTSAIQTQIGNKANTASPTFTGTVRSVTPTTADDSTCIATTAFVKAQNYGSSSLTLGTGAGNAYYGDCGNAAYAHSIDSSQAHSDYLINNGSDVTSGTLTSTNTTLGFQVCQNTYGSWLFQKRRTDNSMLMGLKEGAGVNGSLALATNNVERILIDIDGNVGIGTSAPVGTTNYGVLQLGGTSGGILKGGAGNSDTAEVQFNAGGLTLLGNGATNINFYTNNQHRAIIDSNGNVGIGTTTPSSSIRLSLKYDSSAVDGLGFEDTRSGSARKHRIGTGVGIGGGFGIYDETSATLPFSIEGATPTNTLHLDSAGYVGIGTITPSTILHVDDNAATGTGLLVTGGAAGGNLATFTRDLGATGTISINSYSGNAQMCFASASNTFSLGVENSSGYFKISDNAIIGTNDRLIIDNNGNIGIGAATPSEKLEVVGGVATSDGTNCATMTYNTTSKTLDFVFG